MSRFTSWFESRLPVGRTIRSMITEEIPGGPKFTYALGSTTLLSCSP
jgi:hypothetical protein